MINIKSEKGITIVSLIITIVILLILSSVIIVNINSSTNINKVNYMYADLKLLEEKILVYYKQYGDIPKKSTDLSGYNIIERLGTERNINDNDNYYEIDLSKLDNITLNYGSGGNFDIYIINEKTLTIYYLAGVENEDIVYHAYPYEYSQIGATI